MTAAPRRLRRHRLLLFRPYLAFIALAIAIVLLYRGRTSGATRTGPRYVSDDSSI